MLVYGRLAVALARIQKCPLLPMYRLDDDGAPDLTFATTGDEPFPGAALQPPQIDASWLCTLLLDVKKYE
jgi:hypothetical protein